MQRFVWHLQKEFKIEFGLILNKFKNQSNYFMIQVWLKSVSRASRSVVMTDFLPLYVFQQVTCLFCLLSFKIPHVHIDET